MKGDEPLAPFWQVTPLAQMSDSQWESLCDGCGKCCLHKLQDEDTDEVYYTQVACRLLDLESCRCTRYPERSQLVTGCLDLRTVDPAQLDWLPDTCAYRLVAANEPLPDWHPLVTGDPASVHRRGASVRGKILSEDSVREEDMQDHIIQWVNP